MKIAIIGGGLTGLAAAYYLTKNGQQITIFEKENTLGGLASSFKKEDWSWSLEKFFHHFFVSDKIVKNLISELGLERKLFFKRVKSSIFKNGQISVFDSPFSVLSFPHLSLEEKLRVGLVTLYLKTVSDYQKFEEITASDWLRKFYGQKAYQLLLQPLLRGKFGDLAEKIAMVWFWARIKKRSSRLGYLRGGLQSLIEKLTAETRNKKGKIFLNQEIKNLEEVFHFDSFDKVIVTTPTPVFLKICSKKLPGDYKRQLRKLQFIGSLNLVLSLKKRFFSDYTYWLNINELNFPFVAVVEHTNFVDKKYYGNHYLLYVGGYYPSNHPYFKMKKGEILREFLPYLQKINPQFNQFAIYDLQLAINLYAQPIIPVNYSQMIPSLKTPLKNVYLANQSLIYPWDRGVNYAIKLGERAAKLLMR